MHQNPRSRNAARVKAGKLNRLKRGPLTDAGLERLRQTALTNRPWERSTGPRTPAGKSAAVHNGKTRQIGEKSVREVRGALAELTGLASDMVKVRALVKKLVAARS